MKRSKYVQLSLAASVALAISGEASALEQQRFQSVEQCVDADVAAEACTNAYVAALTEHRRIAPAYDDKAACDADFAVDWCQKNSAGRFVPKLGGFKVPPNGEQQDLNALANAQLPAGDAAATQTSHSAPSTVHSSGGSGNGWLSGWLIGNSMSNNSRSDYDSNAVYRERNSRQSYDTSTLNRRIESAPTSRSQSVDVASSTSRGGFGSQSSARSGWGGWGSSSS
ncbi:DUF1190 domain-containing protein [Pseudomonas sp. efr-133-TYG-5]|jgi:uncharacterized protein YgiB involved in biofilm formation|uniref:DUF1190 domain-containing protein n=1 Tax=Pseudomonas sp. efr-133-TYG-5 TaxID=3040310 RepID=UPI00255784CF|nr:DUF1190 domain-containing protein [Pseudomonas sp. efr-133-TYG-5]